MWILYAFASAFFAGVTAVLAKVGIRGTDSDLATALRTVVILIFAWIIVFIVGSQATLPQVSYMSFLFLILSGLTTGASWICYFKALQLGDVNKVAPIDKSSTVLTMLLAFALLGEPLSVLKGISIVSIAAGTYLMIQKKQVLSSGPVEKKSPRWLIWALLSAVFASLTAILGKVGIEGVESNLGTAVRTFVVLIMAWGVVFWQKKQVQIRDIDRRSWCFIGLSGLATGLSWLFYYRALQEGPASVVVPIDKLSIIVTVLFAGVFLKEKLSRKAAVGLLLIVSGSLLLLVHA